MVDNLPSIGSTAPYGQSPGEPFVVLQKCVGQQVSILRQSAAMEVARLPDLGVRSTESLFQNIEYALPGVAAAGCARFPIILGGHALEIRSRRSKFSTMKDRLAAGELCEHIPQLSCGRESR